MNIADSPVFIWYFPLSLIWLMSTLQICLITLILSLNHCQIAVITCKITIKSTLPLRCIKVLEATFHERKRESLTSTWETLFNSQYLNSMPSIHKIYFKFIWKSLVKLWVFPSFGFYKLNYTRLLSEPPILCANN